VKLEAVVCSACHEQALTDGNGDDAATCYCGLDWRRAPEPRGPEPRLLVLLIPVPRLLVRWLARREARREARR
jgi:hypothetical protein